MQLPAITLSSNHLQMPVQFIQIMKTNRAGIHVVLFYTVGTDTKLLSWKTDVQAISRWLSNPYFCRTTPSFSQQMWSYDFWKQTKMRKYILHTPKISEKFAGEWTFALSCCGQIKIGLRIVQLKFNCLVGKGFKALGTQRSRKAKGKYTPVFVAFPPSPFLCMGSITAIFRSPSALPDRSQHWHTRISQIISSLFKALSVSGPISSQTVTFSAFNVLRARDYGRSIGIIFPSALPVFRKYEKDNVQEIFEILSVPFKDLVLVAE